MRKLLIIFTLMLGLGAGTNLLNTPKNAYAEEIVSVEENISIEENVFIDEEGIVTVANYILGALSGSTGTALILIVFKKWLKKMFSKNIDSINQTTKLIETANKTCNSLTETISYAKATIEELKKLSDDNAKVISENVEELKQLKEEMVDGLNNATNNLNTLKKGVDVIIATNPNLVKNGSARKYMEVGKKYE